MSVPDEIFELKSGDVLVSTVMMGVRGGGGRLVSVSVEFSGVKRDAVDVVVVLVMVVVVTVVVVVVVVWFMFYKHTRLFTKKSMYTQCQGCNVMS